MSQAVNLPSSTDNPIDVKAAVLQAEQQIRPYIRETLLEYSDAFSQISHSQVFLKLENLQLTGSFKIRGAINKLLSLTPEQRAQGIVAASSGNHGVAVAYGLKKFGIPGEIFVPETVASTKLEAIQRLGVTVRKYGDDAGLTESYARSYAAQNGKSYVAPYNDLQVLGGQGTIAVELVRQLNQIDAVFVPVGGGGLISGIAGYLKAVYPQVSIIGCSPQNSPVMAESVKAKRIVEMASQPTLSDGTAGGVEAGAITFELCQSWVDEFVLVSEAEICQAMRLFLETQHQLLEGAAGAAIAGFLKHRGFQNRNVAIIVCGANISLTTLKSILP